MELSEVDIFFAENLLKNFPGATGENRQFLATLLAWSRLGHLCLDSTDPGALTLPPALVDTTDDPWPNQPIKRQGTTFYLQKNWVYETRFLNHLRRLLKQKEENKVDIGEERATSEQKEAIRKALALSFSVIAGGPGTGKTFTAARIVELFLEKNPAARICLAAPTGKAARQLGRNLSPKAQLEISTLHALLGLHRESDFMEEPSPLMADLLLVDECSMIDARLFSYLLSAVRADTHLVLMGDPHQLPAVDSGSLFADLVDLLKSHFPHHLSLLTKPLRSDRREILEIMEAIEAGELPEKYISPLGSQEEIIRTAVAQFSRTFADEPDPDALFAAQKEFCLLSCLRKGPFGADALNEAIASRMQQKKQAKEVVAVPILITRSDEELDLYNGDVGMLLHTGAEEEWALFGPAPYRKIKASTLPPYEFAYCLSVHKSQGSEYENVLLLAPPGSENFGREILYTGATRAKKSLKIYGDAQELKALVERPSRKISALHARVKSCVEV